MPRPCKRRRVCAVPGCKCFGPKAGYAESTEEVLMTLDEFETIRLIDMEGMTQEECAVQMGIGRTTAQAIYNSARTKLAECLVRGSDLNIAGGNYEFCLLKRISRRKTEMRIAVTYENGQVFQHFGHTEAFKVYDVEEGKVTASEVVSTNGSGHGALAGLLNEITVDVLICGGIGAGAQNALAEAGIKLYGGVSGDADQAVEAFLAGNLDFNPNVKCNHHGEHHHEGNCGSHGCGGHTCGH
ncbi:MAG: NifB/NifX family molybdenum-iron cluster-binding protein [Lachnospiraceae bacterium]|nr:NifB/NifX family molybdenum-iron cluster-binding protein [Lachnospiraceae bacterium]